MDRFAVEDGRFQSPQGKADQKNESDIRRDRRQEVPKKGRHACACACVCVILEAVISVIMLDARQRRARGR